MKDLIATNTFIGCLPELEVPGLTVVEKALRLDLLKDAWRITTTRLNVEYSIPNILTDIKKGDYMDDASSTIKG